MGTPIGEFTVLHKRFGWRMVGDDYDLPGVPFPVYITRSAVAIHGTSGTTTTVAAIATAA